MEIPCIKASANFPGEKQLLFSVEAHDERSVYALDLLQLNGKDLKNFPWPSGKRSFES